MATTITLDSKSDDVVILGPTGRRVNLAVTPATRQGLTKELGAGGPSMLAGTIVDDEEHNKKLRGLDGVKIFDKMRRSDAQVAAVMGALTLPILSAERVIDRPEDDEAAAEQITDEHLDFARDNLFRRIDFSEVLRHALSAFWAGYSWFEKVYAAQDGRLVLDRLASRLAMTLWKWETDERGDLTGITQRVRRAGKQLEVTIPRNKVALFAVGKESGDFGGISILRPAYKSYAIKDALYKLEAIRFERYAVGVPVITLPDEYTDDMLTMAKDIAKNWRGAEQSFAILVGSMKLELAQLSGSQSLDIQPAIRHHNEEIAKSVLAQFINLGTSETGSRALGESMMEFFYDAIEGHAKSFAAQFNREVLWPTMDLNFPGEIRPELRFEDLGSASLGQLATGLASLRDFVNWDGDTENYIRRRFGLPQLLLTGEEVAPPRREPPPKEPVAPLAAPLASPLAVQRSERSGQLAAHDVSHDHVRLSEEDGFWRELREPETFVKLRSIDARLEDGKDAIVSALMEFRDEIGEDLSTQIKRQWAAGPKGFAQINVTTKVIAEAATALEPELTALFEFGRDQVEGELKRQAKKRGIELKRKRGGVRTTTILRDQALRCCNADRSLAEALQLRDEGLTPDEIRELTKFRAGEMVTRLSRKTMEAAVAMAGDRWRTQGGREPTGSVLDDIMEEVFSSVEREAKLTASLTASESLNLGRDFEFRRFEEQIETIQYSAILDEFGCPNCSAADGEEMDYGSEEYYDLNPPLNSSRFGPCE